jgi:hypothetical protein
MLDIYLLVVQSIFENSDVEIIGIYDTFLNAYSIIKECIINEHINDDYAKNKDHIIKKLLDKKDYTFFDDDITPCNRYTIFYDQISLKNTNILYITQYYSDFTTYNFHRTKSQVLKSITKITNNKYKNKLNKNSDYFTYTLHNSDNMKIIKSYECIDGSVESYRDYNFIADITVYAIKLSDEIYNNYLKNMSLLDFIYN